MALPAEQEMLRKKHMELATVGAYPGGPGASASSGSGPGASASSGSGTGASASSAVGLVQLSRPSGDSENRNACPT